MTDPYGFSIKCENLKRLYDYWLVEKGDRMMMPRKAISPGKIFSSLPQMVILDVVGRAGRFYTRYAGTAVDGRGGEYLTDRFIDQVKDGGLSRSAIGELRRLVAERRPVTHTNANMRITQTLALFDLKNTPILCNTNKILKENITKSSASKIVNSQP